MVDDVQPRSVTQLEEVVPPTPANTRPIMSDRIMPASEDPEMSLIGTRGPILPSKWLGAAVSLVRYGDGAVACSMN